MTTNTASSLTQIFGELRPDTAEAAILECLGRGVVVADRAMRIRYRNAVAARLLPEGPDLGSALSGIRPVGLFTGWTKEVLRVLDAGEVLRFDGTLPGATAESPTLVSLCCRPFRDQPAARPSGVLIVIEDLTEHAVDDASQVTGRLASLGRVAARVAHELNNPLDGILRYINLAIRLVGDADQLKLKSYLTESRTGLIRMIHIIGDLLEFSRRTEGAFEEMNINEVIEQGIRAVAAAAEDRKVVIAADFHRQAMPVVRGSRLYQVCCNLFKNAIDAMPSGGRLFITSGLADDHVVIRVADTGVGLPAATEKVFEPFFTTKPPGQGTGLGLAICKEFVEDMHGAISAAPNPEGGAVFTVRIPVSSCHEPSPVAARVTTSPRRDPTGPAAFAARDRHER